MPEFRKDDLSVQTVLEKDGDPPKRTLVCHTLGEAIMEVCRWPEQERRKARFRMTGKSYAYTWADVEPHTQ